jgi:hypothetical protein
MKRRFENIKMFCIKHRFAVILFALLFAAVVTVSITVPIAVVNGQTLEAIEITTLPTKTEYIERQELDTSGLKVSAKYAKGKTEEISDYSIDKTVLKLGDNLVTVSYTQKGVTKTATFMVTARERSVSRISVTTEPTKRSYISNTYFEPTGMVVMVIYDNGETSVVTDYTYNKTDLLQVGDKMVTISYKERGITKTATVPITVSAKVLERIEITSEPLKLSYIEKQLFETEGLVVTAVYNNGEKRVITDYTIDNTEPLTTSYSFVIISYTENDITREAGVSITVSARMLTGIMVTGLPLKLLYSEKQLFDPAGIIVTASYDNGEMRTITDYTIDKTEPLTTSDYVVTISYQENGITENATVDIAVTARKLESLELTELPEKTMYIERNLFDTTGMVITAYYDNGDSEAVTDYSWDKTEPLTTADNAIVVTYIEDGVEKTATIIIVVNERSLASIEITEQPTKLVYVERTYFDSDGLVVTALYDNEESEIITSYHLDKGSVLQIGDDTVTVSYAEKNITKTATVSITVNPRQVTSLEVTAQPAKQSYLEGTPFEPTGLVIKAYFDNGEEAFVSGWDYDKKGALAVSDTVITITYGGKSATVSISVNPKILKAIMASAFPQKVLYTAGEYFDFIGLEIYARYENAADEIVMGWDYDKKEPLAVADNQVIISYVLHGVEKTIVVNIAVMAAPEKDPEQDLINDVLKLLPPTDELTADDLDGLEYALSLLDEAQELTPEQEAKKEELAEKRQEIIDGLPPVPEAEYEITYAVANGLEFSDIDYGINPLTYKNSDGVVTLNAATSSIATAQGYIFIGWVIDGQTATAIKDVTENITVYAIFELTATVKVMFLDYDDESELLTLTNVLRTGEYNFEAQSIAALIYSAIGALPISYYTAEKARIATADFSIGKIIIVYVKTSEVRELHLANAESVTVAWYFDYTDDNGTGQASKTPTVGTVFVVPVGATVTMIAMHANIKDILVDGVSKGQYLNSITVQAVFILVADIYPASVTFTTALSDITTISFVGYNQHEVIYLAGWDGYMASIDLDRLAFIYDEANVNYLVTYTIAGTVYYFADVVGYEFSGDTTVWVTRVRNSFAFTLVYANGTERFDNLVGKQTLQDTFSEFSHLSLELMQKIFDEGTLYSDEQLQNEISLADLLATILRGNVTIYSNWIKPNPSIPEPPTFEDVDYSEYDFAGNWTSLFHNDGNILSSELVLTADGLYIYKTYVNGVLSASISGVYRIESDAVVLKTFALDYEYPLVDVSDLEIDIAFVADGLVRATFISISGTVVTRFEHTLTRGQIRPVNYTNRDFVGVYTQGQITIELLANGTAVITYDEITATAYYRVTEDGRLFIYSNGVFGTGEIEGLLGGNK